MKRPEHGQITVMVVGFFVVVGLLAVVVINASSAYLQRQVLDNVADGAALAAADALRQESIYREGLGRDVPLDPVRARQVVGDYLIQTGNDVASWVVTTQDDRVHVHLERLIDLALKPPGWKGSTRVTAEATALLRVSG